jgi:hypothetical protein
MADITSSLSAADKTYIANNRQVFLELQDRRRHLQGLVDQVPVSRTSRNAKGTEARTAIVAQNAALDAVLTGDEASHLLNLEVIRADGTGLASGTGSEIVTVLTGPDADAQMGLGSEA